MTVRGDTHPDHLRRWHQSPLERLRHTITEANLARHLPPGQARVLDVAGGGGMAAVRLAARGHEVTVLDPAGAMLRAAIDAADAHGVADRLHVVQAAAHDVPEVFTAPHFDLVLCHNLLHYAESADERRAVLGAITAPLRSGGLLSVLGPNEHFAPVRAVVLDGSPELALRELYGEADEWSAPGTVGEVIATLAGLGLSEVVRYGVRCVSDLVPGLDDVASPADPAYLADLERLELALADRMPHLLTARYYHLVARR